MVIPRIHESAFAETPMPTTVFFLGLVDINLIFIGLLSVFERFIF